MKAGRRIGRWTILLLFGVVAALPVPATAATTNVALRNTRFEPATVTIAPGDTVVWRNEDDTDHTVTSSDFDSHPACGALVLQDCMSKGESFSHTFDQPGEFPYRCKLHPSMTGVVTVQAAAQATTTTVATTATTQAPTTSSTASTTTTTRKLATSSTLPTSTTSTTVPADSSTTSASNEAPAFDPDDEGDGGTAAPASSDRGGGSGTVALIVAALLAVAGGGGVLLWRLRPRQAAGPPAG